MKDGVEDTSSEEAKRKWQGAMENYTLKSVDGKTEVIVDMDPRKSMKRCLRICGQRHFRS